MFPFVMDADKKDEKFCAYARSEKTRGKTKSKISVS